jgi:hypothetical protein
MLPNFVDEASCNVDTHLGKPVGYGVRIPLNVGMIRAKR